MNTPAWSFREIISAKLGRSQAKACRSGAGRAPPLRYNERTMSQSAAATCFAPAGRASPEKLQEQSAAVVSIEMLRAVLDALPCIAVVVNRERQIVYGNRAALALGGVEALSEALGKRPGEVAGCIHSGGDGGCGTNEACRYCGAVLSVLEGLAGRPAACECRITRRVGERSEHLDLTVTAAPVTVGGEPFAVVSMHDISHQKRRRVLERIFFHDVMNTASCVQGLADALIRRSGDTSAAATARTLASAAGQLMHEIASQRTLAAAEDGELEVERIRLVPQAMVREEVERLLGFPAFRDRQIEIDPQSADGAIETDRALLGRIMSNMLRNALEATLPGEAVRAGCRERGDGVEFWVWNPGEMPREVQVQVFQRSFSTKGEGRGLGAYSMKLLAERYLGGTVSFTSSAAGTEFRMHCPHVIPSTPRSA